MKKTCFNGLTNWNHKFQVMNIEKKIKDGKVGVLVGCDLHVLDMDARFDSVLIDIVLSWREHRSLPAINPNPEIMSWADRARAARGCLPHEKEDILKAYQDRWQELLGNSNVRPPRMLRVKVVWVPQGKEFRFGDDSDGYHEILILKEEDERLTYYTA